MAILNKIVNILVLVAALIAVVFSFFLFSKREKLINGWTSMSGAIQNAAKTLDDSGASGTTASKDLAADKLKLQNYEQLSQILPKLNDNTKKIVDQRNELAKAVQTAALTLSITGIESAQLRNVVSFPTQKQRFINQVRDFRTVRDNLSESYVNIGKMFGIPASVADFNNLEDSKRVIKKINVATSNLQKKSNTFADFIKLICQELGVRIPELNDETYQTKLDVVHSEIRRHQQTFNQTRRNLDSERNRTKNLTNQVENLNKVIAADKATIDKTNKELGHLLWVLRRDGTIELPKKLLTNKDKKECYKYVKGNITYIDKDYGFVTINIGQNFIFTQKYGIKDNQVHFPLEKGKVMTIARSMNSASPVYLGKLLITKVSDNVSIGNLLDGNPDKYKIGDEVYFSDEDIEAALRGDVNAALKKSAR